MLFTLFNFKHHVSSIFNASDLNLLLLYWGNYKPKCPWDSKKWKHWILDADLSWIFRNRRFTWAFFRIPFLNIQLHNYGFNDFHCMSTLLHPSYPIKTWVSYQANFLIQLSQWITKFRTLDPISSPRTQTLKKYNRQVNWILNLPDVLPLCWIRNRIFQLDFFLHGIGRNK